MAILKCKICGAVVPAEPGQTVAVCPECASRVTLPLTEDDRRAAFHNSGIHFRRTEEFDRALSIYQRLAEQPDAEAHWGAALSRYGVVYAAGEDGTYTPTVKRPSRIPFAEDEDCRKALELSEGEAQEIYRAETERITAAEPPREDVSLLLNQGYLCLDDQKWEQAEELLQRARFWEPDNGMAALGMLLAEQKCRKPVDLKNCPEPFDGSERYAEALRCADPTMAETLRRCAEYVRSHTKREETRAVYRKAVQKMKKAKTEEEFRRLSSAFAYISDYHDSAELAEQCRKKADAARRDGIYRAAVMAMNEGTYSEAAEALAMIPGWRDADDLVQVCREKSAPKAAPIPEEDPEQRARKWVGIAAAVVAVLALLAVAAYFVVTRYVIPQRAYDAAEALLAQNQRSEAIEAFEALAPYRDSAERAEGIRQAWYAEAENLLSLGDRRRAAFSFGGLQDYADARERSFALWDEFVIRRSVSAGGQYSVALRNDGFAVSAGRNEDQQRDVGGWLGMIDASAGWSHSVGLRKDGTVTRCGYSADGRSDVEKWRNVVAISAGEWHTVGLLSSGQVIAVGYDGDGRCDVSGWEEIVDVSAGRNHTVGLKMDGTVVAVGDNSAGQCNVSGWTKIIAISAGGSHTVGLRSDGTVLTTGSNEDGQLNTDSWTDICAVSAGYYHTVGLKKDGTVVAAGFNEYGQCNVTDWKDIVTVSAGGWHTIGLKKDGTVLSVGQDYYGQCSTEEWENIIVPEPETGVQ